jgi:radical SAM protein with 4Fe4S-binding SPASM domain
MKSYPRLKPGAVLRARPNCEFPADVAYVAICPRGETYLLSADEYNMLFRCDGLTPLGQIAGLEEMIREDASLLDILSLEGAPMESSIAQKRETLDLVTPCRQAIWHLTRRCNMSCSHCYYLYEDPSVVKNDFSLEEISRIAAHLAELGVEVVRLSGGEAALDGKRFEFAISALKDNCLPTVVNTNGWKHQERIVAAASGNPYLRAAQVSLDGPKFAHNDLRESDSFDVIKSNIKRYVDHGIHVRLISMLTGRWMGREAIWEMCSHVADMGVTDWVIEVPSVTGLYTIGSTGETGKILGAALAFYDFLETQSHRVVSFSFTQVFDWPDHDGFVEKTLDNPICSHDLGLLSFGPEGISYCTLFREQFGAQWKDIGNMEALQYKELWNRIAQQRVSRKIRDNPTCANCEIFHICQGGCPGQYSDAANFTGCDFHSRNLAMVKKQFFDQRGWRL